MLKQGSDMKRKPLLAFALLAVHPALAQSDVDTVHKLSWSENTGWMDWRDAGSPAGTLGVRVSAHVLSGFIWGENVGWINLGSGTPASGQQYDNRNGSDFGVNRDGATGALSGLAWGENIGWINFAGGALATPPNSA